MLLAVCLYARIRYHRRCNLFFFTVISSSRDRRRPFGAQDLHICHALGLAVARAALAYINKLSVGAGITKLACVAFGWGADCLWPLAQTGAVDAWAIVHGSLHRSFVTRVRVSGIVHVRRRPLEAVVPVSVVCEAHTQHWPKLCCFHCGDWVGASAQQALIKLKRLLPRSSQTESSTC